MTPSVSFHGPTANVFTVAFSAHNRYLFAGDTDDKIYKYDLSELPGLCSTKSGFTEPCIRQDSLRSVSCHPWQDEVFLSASEDGTVVLHDGRDNRSLTRAAATLLNDSEFSDVKWHPGMEHIFATGDTRGRVCLRDTRMAFGPLSQRHKNGIVYTYNTTVAKGNRCSRPEVGSIAFDSEGKRDLLALPGKSTVHLPNETHAFSQHYLPTMYSVTDENPIAICSSTVTPEQQRTTPDTRTYENSCTIKHASFGNMGTRGDNYYATGSDDFRAYAWKIPEVVQLHHMREEIKFEHWEMQSGDHPPAFADYASKNIYIPAELSSPFTRLCGHKSIVNSAVIHPQMPVVLTAGIERDIILHSATSTSPSFEDLDETDTFVRPL
ncbi:WD40 repeat-like protein, partial [Gloeophyllum trabeum ATCC 11539]